MGFAEAGAAIGKMAATMALEGDGRRALAAEAEAAWIYWNLWERMPIRFARRNPQRLGTNGRWRSGRPDLWLTFGSRTSLLSGKPSRATTPGNCLINYLYAILESEMTIALLARGLDPGIGIFHADIGGRASLALDAIEAVRPYVEFWLFTYLQSTAFANRDFHELPDGEVRVSHPLHAHLTHTAALWRKACEPVAEWLAQSFVRAGNVDLVHAALSPPAAWRSRAKHEPRPLIPTLTTPLPSFITATRGRRMSAPSVLKQRAAVKEEPVSAMCWECGRALSPDRRTFCGDDCAENYSRAMGKRRPTVDAAAPEARERQRETTVADQRPIKTLARTERQALRRWYTEELQPRLSRMSPAEIERGTVVRRSYAYYIVAGTRVPHRRHYPSLAALVGVKLPKGVVLAMSTPVRQRAARCKGKSE